MKVSFSASGTPREAIQSITDQAMKLRKADGVESSSAAAIMALRDEANRQVKGVDEESSVTVTVSADIAVKVTAAKKPAAPAPKTDSAEPVATEDTAATSRKRQ